MLNILDVLSHSDDGLTIGRNLSHAPGAQEQSLFHNPHHGGRRLHLLRRDLENHYRIGFKTYLAGKAYVRGKDAVSVLSSQLQRIVHACGETCQAGILSGDKVLYIAKVDSPQPVRLFSAIGRALPIHCTAIGKALVCEHEHDELSCVAAAMNSHLYTPRTHATFEDLWEDLQVVRQEGIAHDRGEMTDSIECIAAPVHVDGKIHFGIGISVPSCWSCDRKIRQAHPAPRETPPPISKRFSLKSKGDKKSTGLFCHLLPFGAPFLPFTPQRAAAPAEQLTPPCPIPPPQALRPPSRLAFFTPRLLHAPNRSTALRTVTISAMTISVAFSAALFAYFPITRGELVSHIWTKTVMGSCKDKST